MADNDTTLPDMLNAFYARFEQNTISVVTPAPIALDTPVPSVTAANVRSVFPRANPRKEMGSDSVPCRARRSCADQLTEVFTKIFNLSLLQAKVPTCFKKTTIIPVPKETHAIKTKELIDFRRKGREHASIHINGTEVERWRASSSSEQLRKLGMSIRSLTNFY
eukprot:g45186.t1